MSPTVQKSCARARFALRGARWRRLPRPIVAQRRIEIPRPEGIQSDVNFWIRVYTEVNTNEGFLHDERNLAVVYDTLKFGAGGSSRERQRMVDERRDRHIAALRRIIAALPDRGRARSAVRRRQTPARDVGSEPERHHPQGSDHAHPLPARPGRPLQGRPDPLLELGNPHRRDVREPGPAARARGAAARRVVFQCRGLLESGRRGPVAVHAIHGPALHARRRRGGRAPRSVPFDRSRGPTTGLQLPRARQLAARAHRVQPRRRRHAPREGSPWARTTS